MPPTSHKQVAANSLGLLSAKPLMCVANVSEAQLLAPRPAGSLATSLGLAGVFGPDTTLLPMCATLEHQLLELGSEEGLSILTD